MPREQLHVRHELRAPARGGGAADAAAEGDRLAGDFALEGAEDELLLAAAGGAGVEDVEAGPVDGGAGAGERVEGVPEEGGGVGGVAFLGGW